MTKESGESLARQATEILFDQGTLVDLYIGRPTFQRKLRSASLLLEGVINDNALQLGNKRLMPKEALAMHVTLEGMARTVLTNRSIGFPISGARFVAYSALPALLKRLQDIRHQWNMATTVFVQRYEELREKQLQVLDKQTEDLMYKQLAMMSEEERSKRSSKLLQWQDNEREATREMYPKVEDVAGSFQFSWRMFKVSALEGGAQAKGLMLDDQEILAAQTEMRADLQKWVRSAMAEAHKALGETAKQARELFEKQGKLHPKNLRPIFEAFETFSAIEFTGKSDWRKQVEEAKSRFIVRDAEGNIDIERTSIGINSTEMASGEFKKLLDSIGTLAVGKASEEAGLMALSRVGEFKRVVEV